LGILDQAWSRTLKNVTRKKGVIRLTRFILEFDAGGKCDLCHEDRLNNPLKRTMRLIHPDTCTIVVTVCYLCTILNLLETISKDERVQKDLMKDFYVVRESDEG